MEFVVFEYFFALRIYALRHTLKTIRVKNKRYISVLTIKKKKESKRLQNVRETLKI